MRASPVAPCAAARSTTGKVPRRQCLPLDPALVRVGTHAVSAGLGGDALELLTSATSWRYQLAGHSAVDWDLERRLGRVLKRVMPTAATKTAVSIAQRAPSVMARRTRMCNGERPFKLNREWGRTDRVREERPNGAPGRSPGRRRLRASADRRDTGSRSCTRQGGHDPNLGDGAERASDSAAAHSRSGPRSHVVLKGSPARPMWSYDRSPVRLSLSSRAYHGSAASLLGQPGDGRPGATSGGSSHVTAGAPVLQSGASGA
jgi:hypothetical protein